MSNPLQNFRDILTDKGLIPSDIEADGKLHLSLVYRGTKENAGKFIEAQDELLAELYAPEEEETEDGETEDGEGADTEAGAEDAESVQEDTERAEKETEKAGDTENTEGDGETPAGEDGEE